MTGGQFIGQSNSYCIFVSNKVSGLTNFGGWCWFQVLSIRGHGPPNGNAAVHCEQGGFIACNSGSRFNINYQGVIIAGAATFMAEGCDFSSNGTFALYCYGTATAWVNNSTMQANGSNSIIATNGAYVEGIGCSLAQPWTPAFNTYNTNNGGFISH